MSAKLVEISLLAIFSAKNDIGSKFKGSFVSTNALNTKNFINSHFLLDA